MRTARQPRLGLSGFSYECTSTYIQSVINDDDDDESFDGFILKCGMYLIDSLAKVSKSEILL